ncbi:MAG: purine-nucleoside phosphorylase [Anaerolineae bacterium]|nr:purine-nucleoside phosphorylase [Anaerolineae bacterium]
MTNTPASYLEKARAAAQSVRQRAPLSPQVGLVLGSGWGALAEALSEKACIAYEEIPGFPRSTVSWHAGKLWLGRLEGKPIAVMQGRFHPYEGLTAQEVAFPIACLHALGVRTLIVTNASGAINEAFRPGELMLITDHINFQGENPLTGLAEEGLTRFPDMTYAYDPDLQELAREAAREAGIPLREGVYVAFRGPSFETPAEIRMARRWGADAVGMSSVPEVIMARALGMRVVAISCLSNMAAGILPQPLTAEEVMEVTQGAIPAMTALIRGLVRRLP